MDQKQLDSIRSRTTLFDSVDYLKTQKDVAAYLEAALEDSDPRIVSDTLGTILRAHSLNQLEDTKLSQEAIAVALSEVSDPSLAAFLNVVRALGLVLKVRAIPSRLRPSKSL